MKKSYNRMIKVTLKTGEIEYDIIKKNYISKIYQVGRK